MIVTIVQLPGSGPLTPDEAGNLFSQSAASYLEVPGLIAKTFTVSEDDGDAGAVYWWVDRSSAEAKFNRGWREGLTTKYGSAPVVSYFDAPVHVDVVNQALRVDPPPQS